MKIENFSFILFILLQFSFAASSSSSSAVDAHRIDLTASHLSLAVFQAYAQHQATPNPESYFQEQTSQDRIYPTSFIPLVKIQVEFPPLPEFADWTFFPFYGFTGPISLWSILKSQNDLFGLVGYHQASNTACIVFRGSLLMSEYIFHNLNFGVRMPYHPETRSFYRDSFGYSGWHFLDYNGPLHGGYWDRLLTCSSSLKSALQKLSNICPKDGPKPQLIITGHSLGGACSCILAGLAVAHKYEVPATEVTCLLGFANDFSCLYLRGFGASRVAQKSYGDWLQTKGVDIKLYACDGDHVPYALPFHIREYGWPYPFTYEELVPRTRLRNFGIGLAFGRSEIHDIRLYVYALEYLLDVKTNDACPLFTLSVDSDKLKALLFSRIIDI